MLTCFSDHKCSVHFEQLQKRWKVNQNCYLVIMARLYDTVCQTRPELWPDAWMMYHNNASAHDTLAFGHKTDNEIRRSMTFTSTGPMWFLAIPWTEGCFEHLWIFRHCQHSQTCDEHPKKHPRREIPAMFWTVATSAHTVHSCARSLPNSDRNFLCVYA
jgi:hypothetical protein